MTERCETCRYWHMTSSEHAIPKYGECHRNPKVWTHVKGEHDWLHWSWPPARQFDWCGEWRERERDPMDVTQR